MAKQFINIGIEGNDGTGDSIRDAFNKTNENFTELYAVFGQGGQISFTSLSDTPDQLGSNKIPVSNSAGNAITMRGIVSGGGLSVDFNSDPNNITLAVTGTDVASDLIPSLGGPLNANQFAIGNVAVDQTALNDFNSTHGTNITLDELVITKGFADKRYLISTGAGSSAGELRVRSEPLNASGYTKTITSYQSGNLNIPSHGYSAASNGLPFVYNSTGSAATNLVIGNTYYIRYVDDNTISLHPTAQEATNDNDVTRIKITVSGGTGTQTIRDAAYDSTLSGYYLSTEAIQRQSAVRRQGDTMTGTLFLNDHPGDLAGGGTPNGDDDLQAATKFYVDNTSYASTTNLFVSTAGDDTMQGVPADKYGRSSSYAYKSLRKAAERASQIIDTSPFEPGPYTQTITYGTNGGNSLVVTAGITSPTAYSDLKSLMTANRLFVIKETTAYINQTYPNFTFDISICERDLGLIQDAIVLDVLSGLTTNSQSVQAGKRYYNSNSGLKAINQQATETLAAINFAKSLVINNILTNTAVVTQYQQDVNQTINLLWTVGVAGISSASAKFDVITDIIQDYDASPPVVDGSTYTITISNGNNGYVDQNQPNNKDLVPGKIIRGKVSGAVGEIVSVTAGASVDTVEVFLREPIEFQVDEELEFGNKVKSKQITIRVEAGIYYEDFPIKLPANVSVKGDEFRRTIIRPKNRRSQSPLANLYFFRDTTFDGLSIATQNYGRHYLTDPTTPISVDASYSNMGGYTSAANKISIKKSQIQDAVVNYINGLGAPLSTIDAAKSRRDTGFILDAVVADLLAGGNENILEQQGKFYGVNLSANCKAGITYIGTYTNANIIANESATVQTTVHNMITAVSYAFDPAYNPPKNNDEMDVFLLNDSTIVRNLTVQGHGGFMEVLDPDGQVLTKSPYTQTCSAFCRSANQKAFRGGMYVDGFAGNVQVNVVAVNNAFSLNVSSTAGTGLFLRKPQTPAPFYIAGNRYQVSAITNYDQGAGTATIRLASSSNGGNGWDGTYPTPYSIIIQTAGNRSLLANDFTQMHDLGYGVIATNGGLSEQVSTFTYYNHTSLYAMNGGQIRALNCSSAHGNYGLVSEGSNPNELIDNVTVSDNMVQSGIVFNDYTVDYAQNVGATAVYVYDLEFIPYNQSELEIDHGGATGIARYEISNIQVTTAPNQIATRDGTVYKINLSTAGNDNTSSTGLLAALSDGDKVTIRSSGVIRFSDLNDVSPTRPSTAITFANDPDTVYRSIAFGLQNAIGTNLPANSVAITFDTPYDSVKLIVDNTEAANNTFAGAGTTMGATQGDVVIAVATVTDASDLLRLNAGTMIFGWDGKVHRITSYTDRGTFGTITIQDVNDINATPIGAGIQSSVVRLNSVTLRGVLPAGQAGDITVSISTCRATGHDFLDIGSGGFNTTNFPNVIYGDPQQPDQANEVVERGKGRVFYVSTDQDGFFRVGKYFTVDQGTGTVTFAASIALSNLDGIGFKRGVVVAEFSSDTGMTDNAPDTVPVESAVRGYVNRRLHIDHNNQLVGDPIGAGFVARDGSTSFTNNVSAGGFKLVNLQDPGVDQDAATKSYVDQVNYDTDQVTDNRDVSIINPVDAGQLLVFNGAYRIYTTPANGGLFGGGQTITGSVTGATGTIIDLIQENVPGYGLATRITYTATNLPLNFNTNDTINNGSGVTADVIDGPIHEMGNGVEDVSSDITVSASRDSTQTTINFQLNAGSIINADVSPTAAIQQSKLAMNAATTRANSIGITQADLGLASFDSGDFTVTNGFVTLKGGDVDLTDIQNIAQYQALGRNTTGTGSVEAVSYASIVGAGGALEDSDFTGLIGSAQDPGEALIKTGPGVYALTNVTNSREANSILKTDNNGQLDVSSLAVDGTKIFDVSASTLQLTTPGAVTAYTVIGSNTDNTIHTFSGNEFAFGSDASASPSNDNGSAQNIDPALAADYIYTKFIESNAKTANFTGIAFGSNNPYISALDESSEGKVAFVADGITPLIATPEGLIPGSINMNVGTSGKRFNTMYAEVFDGIATKAQYADLAENYLADDSYDVGTVLIFGGDKEVTVTGVKDDTRVAGVVSQKPAYLMNSELQGDHVTAVALTGRTPVRVVGVVQKGDLLVSSTTQGCAIRNNDAKVGTVIGKALQDKTDPGEGVIEAVVGRV